MAKLARLLLAVCRDLESCTANTTPSNYPCMYLLITYVCLSTHLPAHLSLSLTLAHDGRTAPAASSVLKA